MHRDEILELFEAAATDREHGAAEIERALIRGLLETGTRLRLDSLHRGLKMLAEGQPAMANLRAMTTWMAAVESPASCHARLTRRAAALDELADRFAAHAWSFVKGSQRVVTLSRSYAVAAAVEGAWRRGWQGSVVVLDGTESGRGADQARRLAAHGRVHSRPDGDAPAVLDHDSIVVMVGADAVGDSRFVNAAGTADLLEQAAQRGLHRILIADSGKDVDESVVAEIILLSPRHRAPDGREWPIFEAVPLALISARVTE
jgi:translation initiation factor 2B subunit (eIF-2B alpha/beta/delta family)